MYVWEGEKTKSGHHAVKQESDLTVKWATAPVSQSLIIQSVRPQYQHCKRKKKDYTNLVPIMRYIKYSESESTSPLTHFRGGKMLYNDEEIMQVFIFAPKFAF